MLALFTVACFLLQSALVTPGAVSWSPDTEVGPPQPSTAELAPGFADVAVMAGGVSSPEDLEAGEPSTNSDVPAGAHQADPEDLVAHAEETAEEANRPLVRSKRQVFRLQDLMDTARILSRDRVYPNKAFWYIQNISSHIAKAEDSFVNLKSDPFVLDGYTCVLQVGVNNRDGTLYFGAYLQLCPGPNDEYLHWPFRTPHTFSFNHPMSSGKDVKKKLVPQTNPAYKKPAGQCNMGNGYPAVIKVTDALRKGLIEDDAISVSVTLHPLP